MPLVPNVAHPLCPDYWWLVDPDLAAGNTWFEMNRQKNGGVLNGTLNGGVTWTPSGLKFDGSTGYVRVTRSARLEPASLSVAVSVTPVTQVISGFTTILTKSYAEVGSIYLSYGILFDRNGNNKWEVFLGFTSNSFTIFPSSKALTLGKAYQLCFTFDSVSGTIKLYNNGNLDSIATTNQQIGYSDVSSAYDFFFGVDTSPPNGNKFFTGTIHDALFARRVWFPAEVSQLYTESLNGYPSLLWRPSKRKYFSAASVAPSSGPYFRRTRSYLGTRTGSRQVAA